MMNVECRFVAYEGDLSVVASIVERSEQAAVDRLARADGRFKKLGAEKPVGVRKVDVPVTPRGKICVSIRPGISYDAYSIHNEWKFKAIEIPHGFFNNKPSWKWKRDKIARISSVEYELDHRKKTTGR